MLFPDADLYPAESLFAEDHGLLVRIRVAFGASIAADPATWTWTDVTDWWHTPDEVSITWGRSSGAQQAEPSTLSLTLKNTDGRFTAYDPRSPYWPHARKWTPIAYDINLGDGVWRNRFSGFVRRWPLTWPGASPLMALAKVEAVGVLGRLGRGSPPARSALRRTITASGPVAYWAVEDGVLAESVGSASAGQGPMRVDGSAEFKPVADYAVLGKTVRYGTAALADLSAGGSLHATLPPSATAATASAWTVHVTAQATLATASADVVILEWTTPGGTFTRWQLVSRKATSRTQVMAYNAAGASTLVVDKPSASAGFDTFAVSAVQAGGSINVTINFSALSPASGSVAGTLAGVSSVSCNPTATTNTAEMPFGHLAVWAAGAPPIPLESVANAYGTFVREPRRSWYLEDAVHRLTRLTAEDGITLDVPAPSTWAEATPMGWQAPGTSLGLYQQCEDADSGLLYESDFGLAYLPRDARYNPPVALTIDAAAGQLGMPFEPVDDDQMLRNRWTVERDEGSSAVAEDAESIEHQGEIEASARLNLATDGPLPSHAGWRLHQSTVQEPRYPAVSLNVAAHPELAAAWCAVKPGSRIQVVNPPAQNVPGTVDQLVMGATETYRGRRSWRVTMNVVPASPWLIGTADGNQRVAADGSTLAAAIDADDLTLMMSSTLENGPWVTGDTASNPTDYPQDLRVGGERVTASAIGPGLSDPFTRVGTGWGQAPTGQVWTNSGGAPTDHSTSGTRGVHALPTVSVVRESRVALGVADVDITLGRIGVSAAATGGTIEHGLMARYVDGANFVDLRIFRDPGVAPTIAIRHLVGGVETFQGFPPIPGATSTSPIALRLQAIGSLLRGKAWVVGQPEPEAWMVSLYATYKAAGDIAIRSTRAAANTNAGLTADYDDLVMRLPQLVTLSARGVNGFTRAWPAGTEVDVWEPAVVAL